MTQSHGVRFTLLAATIGTLLPVSAAQALNILGNKFAEPMSGSHPEYDASRFDQLYILGNRIPVAREGAQGPVRNETMGREPMAMPQPQNRKLYLLGNTFWLPGKE